MYAHKHIQIKQTYPHTNEPVQGNMSIHTSNIYLDLFKPKTHIHIKRSYPDIKYIQTKYIQIKRTYSTQKNISKSK